MCYEPISENKSYSVDKVNLMYYNLVHQIYFLERDLLWKTFCRRQSRFHFSAVST